MIDEGERERERERERDKHQFWSSTYLCIHWWLLVCALTGDQTQNLGVLGQCSNQLSYQAMAQTIYFFR